MKRKKKIIEVLLCVNYTFYYLFYEAISNKIQIKFCRFKLNGFLIKRRITIMKKLVKIDDKFLCREMATVVFITYIYIYDETNTK